MQLPTFEVVGVSTTVVVPDQGRLFLGGVHRSSSGSSSSGSSSRGSSPFGPGFGNRGIGRATSSGAFSISATIIDHDQIDRALLAEAARRRGAKVDIYGRPVEDAPRVSPGVVGQRPALRARQRRASRATEQASTTSSQAKADRIKSRWQATKVHNRQTR